MAQVSAEQYKKIFSKQVEKSLLTSIENVLMVEADDYIPIDTSALRDTAKAEVTENNNEVVEVTMTYGDKDVPYATPHYFSNLGHLFRGDKPASIRTSRFAKAGGKKTGLATGKKAKYARAYYAARKAKALTKKALPWLELALSNVSGIRERMITVFVNQFKRF